MLKSNKSNKKVFVIIIIIAIILVVGGIVFAVFMKSNNKEEFFKYASQIFENENGFIDNKIEQLNKKKEASPYENIGKFTMNIENENVSSNTLDQINNNFSISFAGNTDNSSKMTEQLIKINYSKEDNFPILYKKVGDIQAIKLNKVMQKYISVNLNVFGNLFNEFAGASNVSENVLTMLGTEDFLSNLKIDNKKYLKVIENTLDESNFTKVSTSQTQGYSIKISNEKLKDILINILKEVKTDETLIDRLNLSAEEIESLIENLNNVQFEDGTITITLYGKDGKLNKIVLQINDELKIEIEKNNTSDENNYNISITASSGGENLIANISINYKGLQTLENVTSNYVVELEMGENKYTYNYENQMNFTNVNIEEFQENEYVDLNNISSSNLQRIVQLMVQKFAQVNLDLMEKAGLKSQNFLSAIIPTFSSSSEFNDEYNEDNINDYENNETNTIDTNNTTATNTSNNVNSTNIANTTSNTTNTTNTTNTANTTNSTNSSNTTNTTQSDLSTSFAETEKNVFNAKYEKYKGDSVKANDLKALMMQTIANNMADDERKIKVSGDITLTGDEIPDGIENSKTYKVELDYSSDGYVNEIKIKVNE